MGQKTDTGLGKLLKSKELLQTWTGFCGKVLPILHTSNLCC